jgi:hypothetical protein
MGFMPCVPNYGQSDGYHMHNIVESHGVHYVYFGVGCVLCSSCLSLSP